MPIVGIIFGIVNIAKCILPVITRNSFDVIYFSYSLYLQDLKRLYYYLQ